LTAKTELRSIRAPESREREQMKKSQCVLLALSTLALGAWDWQSPDPDQLAQHAMIGLSKRDLLACLGNPQSREGHGQATEIWTYAIGRTRGYGPQWAFFLNPNLPPFSWPAGCEVKIVMTNARVSQVGYAAADGGWFPLGQECVFPVESCIRAP
jgi:hypothetical protein